MKKQIWVLMILLSAAALGTTACGSKSSPASPSNTGSNRVSYSLDFFFGKSGSEPMNYPEEIRLSGNTLWLANNDTLDIGMQAWTTGGSESSAVTNYGANALEPFGVGIGPDGYVYAGDINLKQVVELSPTGNYVAVFGSPQVAGNAVFGIAVDATDVYLGLYKTAGYCLRYSVTGSGNSKVFTYQNTFGNSGPGTLNDPAGMCLSGGNLWVADAGNGRLVEFNNAGAYQMAVTLAPSSHPTDVAVDGSGNLFASDNINDEIQVFNSAGGAVTTFGNGDLVDPVGIALDSQSNLYVADGSSNQVVVFNRN